MRKRGRDAFDPQSERQQMDLFYIPALASFSGSASGTLASVVTGWVAQRRRDRARTTSRTISQRFSPNREFADLPELMSGMDPFRDFSEACRRELHHPR